MSVRRRSVLGVAVTLGAVFPPQRTEDLHDAARAAERTGIAELWLWEDCFKQGGIAAAAAVLASTERLRVGLGLLPVPLRNVALTAMELATLARLFPGRILPGVGHGVAEWMQQVGAGAESPMTLLREYTHALRALLRGESVSVSGRYVRLHDVRLDYPPDHAPPLFVGGRGPRTLRLAGELGDGALADTVGPDDLPGVVDLVRAGRESGGIAGRPEILVWLPVDAGVPAHRVADGVAQRAEAGATTVAAVPAAANPTPIAEFVEFVGRDVAPLVR